MDGIHDEDGALAAVDELEHGLGAVTAERKESGVNTPNLIIESRNLARVTQSTYLRQLCKSASIDANKSDNRRWWTYDQRNSGMRNGGRDGPGLNVWALFPRLPATRINNTINNKFIMFIYKLPFLAVFFGETASLFS